ncbi:phage virion morphogenesis protein [Trinickia terrae]|uniref:Phage virion morphogenesis protein n=1 Tax=Trinickia terrae TaxID=2571161 RepID=A0A4U1HST0_9BURK|nr:phage virion morphogenesis protein [Trinickia terrae]TKC83463.1 phage virion morphogenesis protein [Trinickia terrae]
MGYAVVDELNAVEAWANALLAQLSPAARRAATRDIARKLRITQQMRIAAQQNPDGSAYEPRKAKAGDKRLREKRGRIKRAAMFAKLRTTRWLKVEADANGLAIGFAGRVARLARIHQLGEKAPVTPGGPAYRYPARVLLGFTDMDRAVICNTLLRHITN